MELVDVRYIGSDGQYQTYSPQDIELISKSTINGNYGGPNDYIEYFIKDLGDTILNSNYNVTQYQLDNAVVNPITGTTTQLSLDPETDVRAAGYGRGVTNIKYNFFTTHLLSSPNNVNRFWIKEISYSRTEIKVARQDLANAELLSAFNGFNSVLSADTYYPTFYLNFGFDVQIIGVNAVYVEEEGNAYIIFKLYEPLPIEYDLKSTFWVVTQVADSAEFNVSINITPEAVVDSTAIKGPNFKVTVKDKVGQTTPYYSYESLLLTSVTSSYQQLKSMMDEKGIQINVDYSNFSNFVHFSSATERLYNFVYKMQLIESASAGLQETNTSTAKVLLQNQIDTTITNFDGYEYYLYFTSASAAWPKQKSSQPFNLYSVTSSQVINWLGTPLVQGSKYQSASYYDDQNKDLLLYATPSYVVDDAANAPYLLFLNMIGQHFDNIWIYLKDVTNHYSAENNPFIGVSMDQVADALRSFGIQLYTNTSITDNIYYSMLGINQTGSALPVTSSAYSVVNIASSSLYPLAGQPWLTASLALPPFGQEKINRYVTTFVTQSVPSANISQSFATLPTSQLTGEVYKRLYHNLAYLLKTRGTERGVKALITTFGIPGNILTPHEYGGYNIYQDPGIQEISNTKIITGSVLQISSSLLNPYTTIQYYQNNIDKSSNDIQIGFSPADSINASITSSRYVTASNDPGYFNIMQLIGAPDLQYSSSYTPLVQLANTYFNAEYTSRYDVWDFIRVIKYYNNSVFKMLRDWVPARSSASTGIIVQSHMLERNKYPRHEPTFVFYTGSVQIKMVTVSGSDGGAVDKNTYYVEKVPIQYQSNSVYLANDSGTIYMSSSNNIQKYTGEFSGSHIILDYSVFPQEEVSSYIYPWTSSVAPSENGGQNKMFLTYSVSPTLNNITGAVISQKFLDLDYNGAQITPTNYGLVTQSIARTQVIGAASQSIQPYSQYAQLQDYNYNLPSTVNLRYSGSYLQCYAYNKYTTASMIGNVSYSGDISYANNPVINYYSDKLGLFTQIQSSSFIPGAVNATLAYLADVSGGLFELNQNNKHWVDVQNIFVQGTQLTVKQFDNKKYSNQVATDGVKTIYNSGYNYTPQLYFSTASDSKIYFQYNGATTVDNLSVLNYASPNNYISGSNTTYYPVKPVNSTGVNKSSGYIYDIFNNVVTNAAGFYTIGSSVNNTFPSYSAPYAGIRTFTANLNVTVEFPTTDQEVTYSFTAVKNGSTIVGGPVVQAFKSVVAPTTYFTGSVTCSLAPGKVISGTILGGSFYEGPISLQRSDGTPGGISTPDSSITTAFVEYTYYDAATGQDLTGNSEFATSIVAGGNAVLSANINLYSVGAKAPTPLSNVFSGYTIAPVSQLTTNLNLSLNTDDDSYSAGDDVTFELVQTVTASAANYTASVSQGSLTVSEATTQGSYPYATNSTSSYISGFNNNGIYGYVTMSSDLSNFNGYQQVPYFVSGSPEGISPVTASYVYSSSLYSKYGDINVAFTPQSYDKLILQDKNGIVQNLDIYNTFLSGSNLILQTVPTILPAWVTAYTLVKTLLLLRRYNDEQNVIVNFTKPIGQTSYGFILPNDINPLVLSNINTLQAKVQAQLLSTQASTTINTV